MKTKLIIFGVLLLSSSNSIAQDLSEKENEIIVSDYSVSNHYCIIGEETFSKKVIVK